jgi:hypothetical protein
MFARALGEKGCQVSRYPGYGITSLRAVLLNNPLPGQRAFDSVVQYFRWRAANWSDLKGACIINNFHSFFSTWFCCFVTVTDTSLVPCQYSATSNESYYYLDPSILQFCESIIFELLKVIINQNKCSPQHKKKREVYA